MSKPDRQRAVTALRDLVSSLSEHEAKADGARRALGRHVKKMNRDLNMPLREIAEIAKVAPNTIINWIRKGDADGSS